MEQEQQNYLNLVDTIAHDVTPLGKMTSEPNVEDSDASEAATEGKSRLQFFKDVRERKEMFWVDEFVLRKKQENNQISRPKTLRRGFLKKLPSSLFTLVAHLNF